LCGLLTGRVGGTVHDWKVVVVTASSTDGTAKNGVDDESASRYESAVLPKLWLSIDCKAATIKVSNQFGAWRAVSCICQLGGGGFN
jgi:hypothetical protein